MQSEQLKKFAPWALGIGVAGLIAAGGVWAVMRTLNPYVQGSLAVGLLGLALAALFNPGAILAWAGGRQARYGSNVLVMVLALLGILIVVNYLAYKNPKQFDLSQDQLNTLAPETLTAIGQIKEPVQAIGFYTSNFQSQQLTAQELLQRYKVRANGKFNYEFHDPQTEPALAKQYGISSDGTLVLVSGQQKEELTFASEAEITGALIRFANPGTRAVYFLTGHGERDIADTGNTGISNLVDLLKKQNYTVAPLDLQITTTVPADARAIVIAGPQVALTKAEVDALSAGLAANPATALLVMLDPAVQTKMDAAAPDPLVDYLSQTWGLWVPQNLIIDLTHSAQQSPAWPVNDGYETSPITDKLQKISTVFPVARSVVVSGTTATFPNITYTPLIPTSPSAWGETDFAGLVAKAQPTQDPTDAAGPLWIAVAAQNTQTKARIVVFGDSDFASNDISAAGANTLLFTNSVNWATAEESLINLTSKVATTRSLVLRDAVTINLIFFLTVVVLPLAVLVWGGVVWFMRRRHV